MSKLSFGFHSRSFVVLVGTGACLIGGCAPNAANDRMWLGDGVVVEGAALEPTPGAPGLDREKWAKTTVVVPVDGTAHSPTYTGWWHLPETARERGEYPTALTALETGDGYQATRRVEAAASPVIAAAETVGAPVGAILYPPVERRWSPNVGYERTRPAGQVRPGAEEVMQALQAYRASGAAPASDVEMVTPPPIEPQTVPMQEMRLIEGDG